MSWDHWRKAFVGKVRLLPPHHVHLPSRGEVDCGYRVAKQHWKIGYTWNSILLHLSACICWKQWSHLILLYTTCADGFCGVKAGAIQSASAFTTVVLCPALSLAQFLHCCSSQNAWKPRMCPTLVIIKGCFAQEAIAFPPSSVSLKKIKAR